jgi:acyl-CoA synthetase (AMP-forming)/AMP-acid ligase II
VKGAARHPTQALLYADLLARNALLHGTAPALIGCFGGFDTVTHQALHTQCQAQAAALASQGVVCGDRIAVLASNAPQTLALLGAAAQLGAIVVLLNTRSSAAEIAALVADAAPRLLFSEPAHEALLAALPPDLPCHALNNASARLPAWPLPSVPAVSACPAPGLDDAAAWVAIPTAAVDGRPRLALLSQASLLHQALQLAHAWSLSAEDRHLALLPLFHMAGLGLALAVQCVGGASVLMPRFDAREAVRAIDTEGVSCFASFAPLLSSILDAAQAAGSPLASLRHVTGLEPLEVATRLEAHQAKARFWAAYGQTETGGLICLAPATQVPGSAGRPLPQVALRIDSPQPTQASGEILVRGPCVFNGYWQRPAETAHAARDGWHHTGDLGRLDERGVLWFQGRAPEKALIKSGGENIYPAEVEQALQAHPAVRAAVVLGVPDARWGEAVRAVCLLHAGQSVAAETLADFVVARIARFKRPRDVVFVDALPTRPDGAWDRAAIAALHGG